MAPSGDNSHRYWSTHNRLYAVTATSGNKENAKLYIRVTMIILMSKGKVFETIRRFAGQNVPFWQ